MQKKCHNNPLAAYHHHHHHAPPPPPPGGRLGHAHSVHHLQESGPRSSTVTICEREIPHKPGAGVGVNVAKNANGESLHIELKEHPSMSFRNKGHVDIELRYKPSPPCKGKPLLEKIVVSESEQRCPLQEKLASQKKRLQAKLEKPVSGTYYALWCIFLLIHYYFFHFLALQGALGQGGSWRQALAESQGSGQHFYEVTGKISLCIKWIEKPINFIKLIDSENYYLLVIKDFSKIHKNLLKIVIPIPLEMP